MDTSAGSALTPETWRSISAFALFDDAEQRGFGTPPFRLGGGSFLVLRFRHRLTKHIDFFGYDAQWLSVPIRANHPLSVGRSASGPPDRPGFRAMKRNAITAALNALSNASRTPVSEADLLPILSTGDGPGHLVRTPFEDCSFETLDRLAASRGTLHAAYGRAKRVHCAANAEFEADDHVDRYGRAEIGQLRCSHISLNFRIRDRSDYRRSHCPRDRGFIG